MAEGIFSLEAEIVPVVNDQNLQRQAAAIAKQFNSALEKQLKPVDFRTTSTKQVTKEIVETSKAAEALNKTLDIVKRTLETIKNSASSAVDSARRGFISFANAVNLTNTKFIKFSGSIREAIRDNHLFKTALNEVNRAGTAIRNLPDSFRNMFATISAGTSDIQKAAEGGDRFSKSLLPFLTLGAIISRQINNIGASIARVSRDIDRLASATGAPVQLFPKSVLKDAPLEFEKVSQRLQAASFKIKDVIADTFGVAGADPTQQIQGLRTLRKEYGDFTSTVRGRVSNLGKAIRSELFDVSPESLSFFDRTSERFSRLSDRIRDSFSGINRAGIRDTLEDLKEPTDRVSTTFKNLKEDVTGVSKAVGTQLKTSIQQAEKAFTSFTDKVQQGGFKSAITSTIKNIADQIRKAFSGEGGERGAAGLGLLLAPIKAIEIGVKGLGKVIGAPFKLLGASSAGAVAPVRALGGAITQSIGLPQIGLAGGLAAAIGALGALALNAAAKFETLQVALEGILGKGQGKVALQEIADFAAVTPFRLETATQAVIKLSSSLQGLDQTGALAIINEFSGAAAAVGATDDAINRVILGFTQISARGKLSADNVRQITEALPNISQTSIIQNLAENMGKTKDQAKELYEQGLIPAKEGLQAIVEAANEVPGATEALEKQSKTFAGLTSTTKDLLDQVLAKLGGPLLGVAVFFLTGINDALTLVQKALSGSINPAKILHDVFSDIGDVLSDIIPKFDFAATAIGHAAKELGNFLHLGGAVEFFGRGVRGLINHITGADKAIEAMSNRATTASESLAAAQRALDPLARSVDAVTRALSTGDLTQISTAVINAENAQADAANDLVKSQIDVVKNVLQAKSAFEARKRAAEAVTEATNRLREAEEEHNKQVAEKTIQLQKQLADANLAVADAQERQTEAQNRLDEALKGASAEEAERADLSLASAKLRLRQLIEEEKKAQDELNESQRESVDLTGLSVDEIKSRLSLVRATLANQKAAAKPLTKESAEQKEINALEAHISRRNAELDILDATKKVEEIKTKGSEKDPEVIAARQAVRDAERESAKALEQQQLTQIEINKLSQVDIEFEKQKAGLQKGITDAKIAQRDAERAATLQIAEATGNKKEQLRLLGEEIKQSPELIGLLKDVSTEESTRVALETTLGIKIGENNAKLETTLSLQERINRILKDAGPLLSPQQQNLAKLQAFFSTLRIGELPLGTRADLDALIKETLEKSSGGKTVQEVIDNVVNKLIETQFGGKKTNLGPEALKLFNNEAIKAVALALTEGEKTQEEVNNVIKRALEQIPGVGPINFAQGAIVDKATPGVFGEAGLEALLPLTRPARMVDLLSDSRVLHPVLSALGKITLPGSSVKSQELSSPVSLNVPRRSPNFGNGYSKQEQAKRDTALAKAIVQEMIAAGLNGKQIVFNQDFTAPKANDPLSSIQVRQIAREVKRQIENEL